MTITTPQMRPAGNAPAAASRQAELEILKADYFARGGTITEVAGFTGTVHRLPFNRSAEFISAADRTAVLQRELIDGRYVVRMARACLITGRSDDNLKKRARAGTMPQPVPGVKPIGWDEEELRAWAAANPNPLGR